VTVTGTGMAAARDRERTWLSKAIDKQPITFVQVLISLVGFISGWVMGLATAHVTTLIWHFLMRLIPHHR
jgi:hypothetical protein